MNENGRKQATNLGKALADVADEPFILAHSPLRRARQTADIVAQQIMTHPKDAPTLLNSLREIDFGPFAEGQPASNVQQKMMQTYAAWSLGQVDCRPRGGGESGREVLERARHALQELVDLAVSDDESIRNVKHVVAVTHSAFLRVMLGALLDEPLWQAAGAKIYNGSVTVVDVLVTHDSVGGPDQGGTEQRRKAVRFPPSNLDLDQRADPSAIHVVRVNEYRHLPPSTLQ
jgi:probable phosphoglycerate mutase